MIGDEARTLTNNRLEVLNDRLETLADAQLWWTVVHGEITPAIGPPSVLPITNVAAAPNVLRPSK